MSVDNVIVTVHTSGHAEEVQLTGEGSRDEVIDELNRMVSEMQKVKADTIVRVVREAVHDDNYEQLATVNRILRNRRLSSIPMGSLKGIALQNQPLHKQHWL